MSVGCDPYSECITRLISYKLTLQAVSPHSKKNPDHVGCERQRLNSGTEIMCPLYPCVSLISAANLYMCNFVSTLYHQP